MSLRQKKLMLCGLRLVLVTVLRVVQLNVLFLLTFRALGRALKLPNGA